MHAVSSYGGYSQGSRGPALPMVSRRYRAVWLAVLVLCVWQAAWGAGFVYRSSVVVDGDRYFVLFDDAMISMRYAKNWAHGEGLVWNPGERVEGYSNFGWTAVMAAVHLLGLSSSQTCLVVQLMGLPVLWLCLVATAVLARACRVLPTVAIGALVLVAAQYSLLYFTLLGLETGLLCALVTFGLAGHVDAMRRRVGCVRPQLWFALAQLVRPDVLPLAVFAAATVMIRARARRFRPLLGILAVVTVAAAHALWRRSYYGEWLPNTYYLKATGWPLADRLAPALVQLIWAEVTLGLPSLLAAIAVLWPKRWMVLLLGPYVIQLAYQSYVGGDAWPLNRFLVPSMPGLFVAASYGLHRLSGLLFLHPARRPAALAKFMMVMLTVAMMNAVHWDHFVLLAPPQDTRDNRFNIHLWLAIEKIADPEARVAVAYAGAVPYFSNRHCCDILGKCDPHIARLPAHRDVRRAGHNKYDTDYTLNVQRPDIVLHMVCPRLRHSYRPVRIEIGDEKVAFFVRRGSEHLRVQEREYTTAGVANEMIMAMLDL